MSENTASAWFCNANDAITIHLVAPSPDGLRSVEVFHPRFTYPFFGEDEEIYGYKDLRVNLRFRTNDMRPHCKVSWSKRCKPTVEREPMDVKEILIDGGHLPKVAFVNEIDFDESSKGMGDSWKPPGSLYATIQRPDCTYEVWLGTLADEAIQQLHKRIQIMVPFLIEGGSYIGRVDEEEAVKFDYSDGDRWTIFFLYRKQSAPNHPEQSDYTFIGYSTVYRFYLFRPAPPSASGNEWELPKGDHDMATWPCRSRLSQFVILPPFQGKGNGIRLYDVIFRYYQQHPYTKQFTIENPNEAFDDLRDLYDIGFLRSSPDFNSLKIDSNVSIPTSGPVPKLVTSSDQIESIQLRSKMASRQFSRVLEMHLMSQLPAAVQMTMDMEERPAATKLEAHQQREWQLVVKQRLYRHNRELMMQLEPSERIEKLDETLVGVELEYARLLAAYDKVKKHRDMEGPVTFANKKRRLDETEATETSGAKKTRV